MEKKMTEPWTCTSCQFDLHERCFGWSVLTDRECACSVAHHPTRNTDEPEKKMTGDRTAAIAAYEAGIPSLLPDSNAFKRLVEAHRWGQHHAPYLNKRCPICR